MDKIIFTASIVLYRENLEVLKKTIQCFLDVPLEKKLFLIDNTPNKSFEGLFQNSQIEYIPVEKNIGFGSGHNKIISKIQNVSEFHLILNPDVYFKSEVIHELISQLQNDKSLAMIAPKVLFLDGTHQYSCRRYPKIVELIGRRFPLIQPFIKEILRKGEYRDKNLNEAFYAEYLTGCFQLYKTNNFVDLSGFDERYFLYMEDVDICKKIDLLGKKKLYYPKVSINHILKQGSLRVINLFFRHVFSAIKYYCKWGIS